MPLPVGLHPEVLSSRMASEDRPLSAPMVSDHSRAQMFEPRPGYIFHYNTAGELCKNGKGRALVVDRIDNFDKRVSVTMGFAIDYTDAPRYPLHRMNQSGTFSPSDYQQMKDNVLGNCGLRDGLKPTGQPLDVLLDSKLETRKIAIVCATGPSLRNIAPLLSKIDRSKVAIIALNSAALASEYVDYEFVIDRRVRPEWAKAAEEKGAICVAHPGVPVEFCATFGRERCFIYGHPGRHELNYIIRAAYDDYMHGVCELELAGNVGPSASQFAYLMGFEHIIYVGLDTIYSETTGMHWKKGVNGGGLPYSVSCREMDLTVEYADGKRGVQTYAVNLEYLRAYHMTQGYAYWLLKSGKAKVYNATGEGPIWQFPEPHANYAIENRADVTGVVRPLTPMESIDLTSALQALGGWNG